MLRRVSHSVGFLPAAFGLVGNQARTLFTAPTPARFNKNLEDDGDEFDVFEDDDMWFMEELLSEGGEMDFIIPSDDARTLQGEKQ